MICNRFCVAGQGSIEEEEEVEGDELCLMLFVITRANAIIEGAAISKFTLTGSRFPFLRDFAIIYSRPLFYNLFFFVFGWLEALK
jgi:hypothetical protein